MEKDSNVNITKNTYNINPIELPKNIEQNLFDYNLDKYITDIKNVGLESTWDYICQFVAKNSKILPEILDINNFGELYEIGLAIQNKILKKKSGQYYTPDDVAKIMSEWLLKSDGTAVCDVGCGTGKLIHTYLDLIGYEKARELISSGKIYLYDIDNVALKICKTSIAVKYGFDIVNSVHYECCDFLNSEIVLPKDCKVISNPPYAKFKNISDCWKKTDVMFDTKEYYSAFMEKIFNQSNSTVIITPFSFVSGNKFYSLRKVMSEQGCGYIVSFDNVPGNIFHGKKHGIFNTNKSNSVRASITVFNKSKDKKGFKISPLIRFKNEEREKLLDVKILENTLPSNYQKIDENHKKFEKVDANLINIFQSWVNNSTVKVEDVITNQDTKYFIDMPNTCRYFTTASYHKLSRTGSIKINLNNSEEFSFLYCVINSSFAYWWWRIYDGGITYPVSLLNSMPLPLNLLSKEDKEYFKLMAQKLINKEQNYVTTKVNANVPQENIKFPKEYRDEINERILKILGFKLPANIFNRVHANCYFGEDN